MNFKDWYWRGRVARGCNEPRALPDTRVKSANRLAFYTGWDEEDKLRTVHPEPALAKSRELFAQLKEYVAALPEPEFPRR